MTPISTLGGRRIRTVEGLGTIERPGPMQRAFIEEQAAQCGFCISGMIMSAKALLDTNKNPSETEIRGAEAASVSFPEFYTWLDELAIR